LRRSQLPGDGFLPICWVEILLILFVVCNIIEQVAVNLLHSALHLFVILCRLVGTTWRGLFCREVVGKSAYLTSFVFESEPMPSISPSSTSSSLSLKPSGAFKSTLPNVGPSSSSDSSSSSCAAFEIVALAPRGLEPQSIPSSSSSSKSLSPRASACSRNSDCLLKSSMEKKPSLRPCGSGMYSAASSLSASDSPSLPIATSSSASISDSSKSSTSPSTSISSSSSSSSPSTSSPSTSYVLLGELIEVALGLLPSGIDNAPCLFPDLLDSKPFDVDLFQTQNLLIFIVLAALPLFASFLQALLLLWLAVAERYTAPK
ncbi:hypothetical protein KCU93_g351, partial [Aureobasidium melanogenum]